MGKHLKAGTIVRLTKGMSVRHEGETHSDGIIEQRDGEYYLITMFFDRKCVVERYLCEIEAALINNEWVKV